MYPLPLQLSRTIRNFEGKTITTIWTRLQCSPTLCVRKLLLLNLLVQVQDLILLQDVLDTGSITKFLGFEFMSYVTHFRSSFKIQIKNSLLFLIELYNLYCHVRCKIVYFSRVLINWFLITSHKFIRTALWMNKIITYLSHLNYLWISLNPIMPEFTFSLKKI